MTKTLIIREFTRDFSKHRGETGMVKNRGGKLVGVWTPAAGSPPKVDFAARLKKHFKKPLPVTGAQLLKVSNARP
jgi:hypothetical protein